MKFMGAAALERDAVGAEALFLLDHFVFTRPLELIPFLPWLFSSIFHLVKGDYLVIDLTNSKQASL